MLYEDFESVEFPALLHSTVVDTRTGSTKARDWTGAASPPIIHRKELMLPPDYPGLGAFRALTSALEARGVFEEPTKIGTRRAWTEILARAGLKVENHRIVGLDASLDVDRRRTAIMRNRLSAPVGALERYGLLKEGLTFFDYGCGQGDDVRILSEKGHMARGWDPHHAPDAIRAGADLVNLGFVLNVIESPEERVDTIRMAWSLCKSVLSVAVMLDSRPVEGLKPHRDGYLTSWSTFQKYYAIDEIRLFIKDALGVAPVTVSPGVFFVFRSSDDEQTFLFNRRRTPCDGRGEQSVSPRLPGPWVPTEGQQALLEELWKSAVELGRAPRKKDIPDLAQALSAQSLSLSKAWGWCADNRPCTRLSESRQKAHDDLLVHRALGFLNNQRGSNAWPKGLRKSAQDHFGGMGALDRQARDLLFSCGDGEALKAACEQACTSGVLVRVQEGLYCYVQDRLAELPNELRVLAGCASSLVGEIEGAHVVLVDVAGKAVEFLTIAQPGAKLPLVTSRVRVDLARQRVRLQSYAPGEELVFLFYSGLCREAEDAPARCRAEEQVRRLFGSSSMIFVKYRDLAQRVAGGPRANEAGGKGSLALQDSSTS